MSNFWAIWCRLDFLSARRYLRSLDCGEGDPRASKIRKIQILVMKTSLALTQFTGFLFTKLLFMQLTLRISLALLKAIAVVPNYPSSVTFRVF
ncbi:MAG: hypothetical protein V7L22_17800 [Nostoc sp.]|uniref:hypothetical protein n=1 Tax=Nostoc sp. TaxID=1180 RepID=UPI002FF647D4